MADSYQPGRQQGRGGALARRMMGRDSQSQTQGTGSAAQQVVVVGFNDEILGRIDKNLKLIYALLAKDLKLEEKDLKDKKKEAVTAKGQTRKRAEGKGLVSPIMGGIKKIGKIAKDVSGMGNILDGLITAFTSIFSGWIAGKLPEIFEIVKTTWEKVKNAVMGAVNTVADGAKAVFNFVKNIITAVIDFFKNAFTFIGEQIQRFINWITDLGKKIWEGLQKAWKFVSEIPGKIGNAFKAGWDWLTGGGEKEKPPANSKANKVEAAEVKPGKMPSSDKSLLASLGDKNFSLLAKDKKPKTTVKGGKTENTINDQSRTTITATDNKSVTVGDGTGKVETKADPQSAAVGDMAGQGNMRRKKPKVSPVSSMTTKEGPTKQANTAAAIPKGFRRVNVRGGGSKLIPVTPEAKAQVEAAKNATATTSPTSQQKPAQQPIVVPMQQPAPAAMAVSPPKSGSPVGGSGQDSKSIPSSNPDNFYTFFSAIQYNCMATF